MASRIKGQGLLVIAGPTASGKSALALRLAEALGGVIVNADSMQLYADLRVLTARPSTAEEAQVPHRLYGVLDGADGCSAARWQALALGAIAEARTLGKLPIVVGGTALYLEALLHGLAAVPPVDPAVRAAVRQLDAATLAVTLAQEDKEMAQRLAPTDRQRMARALEVIRSTGQSLAFWQQQTTGGLLGDEAAGPVIRLRLLPDRHTVYARADRRFEAMVAGGALEEVRHLVARGLPASAPIMKALGVPELADLLAGRCGQAEAIARGQQMTRHYIKRQLTWLRNRFDDWHTLAAQENDKNSEEIISLLRKQGLTTQS